MTGHPQSPPKTPAPPYFELPELLGIEQWPTMVEACGCAQGNLPQNEAPE